MLDFLGSAVGGALTYAGAREANRTNLKIAREQMDFQERMSSTAYQRAMQDMRQAGLNPILAYNQGGASSPLGASAHMQNELAPAVSSALDAKRAAAEVRNLNEQNKNLRAQNAQIESQTALNRANSAVATIAAEAAATKLPGLKKDQAIDESIQGTIFKYLERILPFVNSARSFIR